MMTANTIPTITPTVKLSLTTNSFLPPPPDDILIVVSPVVIVTNSVVLVVVVGIVISVVFGSIPSVKRLRSKWWLFKS